MELPYAINLVGWDETDEGDVLTRDGEYLGRWRSDENDHPSFIPDGHIEPLFEDVFVYRICNRIAEWLNTKEDGEAD